MRLASFVALVLLACAQGPEDGQNSGATADETALAAEPTQTPRDLARSEPVVMAAETTLVVEAEVMSSEDVAAAQDRGTTVDTILVAPELLRLAVGDTMLLWDLDVRALDASGAEVRSFAPAFIARSGTVYRIQGLVLRAVGAGEAQFFVEGLPRDPSQPRPLPSTAVAVIVR